MPLQELTVAEARQGIALWHITEAESELAAMAAPEFCPTAILNPKKRKEWLAGRLLVRALARHTGLAYHGIVKNEFGKPFLKDSPFPISLSHSYPYAAAQIGHKNPVGIDVEQPREKLLRVAPRILDPEELRHAGNDVILHCIYWCAKEALFKIYGKRGLLFTRHLHVLPFDMARQGELNGRIDFNGYSLSARLCYRVENDFVLVFTKTADV